MKLHSCFVAISALVAVSAFAAPQGSISDKDSLLRYIYPMAKPVPCPKVTVDVSDMPAAAGWGEAAKLTVQQWFSPLTQLLGTEGFRCPREIRLVIKKHIDAPAYTGGATITVDGQWITAHPNDLGMIVHELTHVIQQYPDFEAKPGWLVEGIADFTRWWKYEASPPGPKLGPNATYHDAYRTTAAFLAWVSEHYDQRLVPMLDQAMRKGKDPMPIFAQLTGKQPQELWDEMRKRF